MSAPVLECFFSIIHHFSLARGRRCGFRDCAIVPLHLALVTGGALPGQESQRTVARRFELPVRHLCYGVSRGGMDSREVVSLPLQSLRGASTKFVDGARRVCGRAVREPRRPLALTTESWRSGPASKLHAASR
jgi:hypothetical protein